MVDMVNSAAAPETPQGADKDAPLKEDIRLLGRLLGDVLRDQEGEAVFDVVETIRQTAVRFRREDDAEAGKELTTLLKKLTRDQAISVVRAFSYFSHLANIAEDQHHIRRRRAHLLAGSAPQQGSVGFALAKLKAAGVARDTVQTFFRDALIAPVLTAHPTEVQRKSMLDAEHDIARLLAERDMPLTPKERKANLLLLQSRIATLVADAHAALLEADGGRRDRQRPVLLPHHLPARAARPVRRHRGRTGGAVRVPSRPRWTARSYVQMGSWIGGDRDGNPNVNAGTMQHALTRHATTILDFYLDEMHALGAELSISTLMVGVSPALQALADASPDASPHRSDEPYRRALIGIYARLAATARALGATNILRKEVGPAAPYPDAAEFGADLQVLIDSLAAHHGAITGAPAAGAAEARRRHLRLPSRLA